MIKESIWFTFFCWICFWKNNGYKQGQFGGRFLVSACPGQGSMYTVMWEVCFFVQEKKNHIFHREIDLVLTRKQKISLFFFRYCQNTLWEVQVLDELFSLWNKFITVSFKGFICFLSISADLRSLQRGTYQSPRRSSPDYSPRPPSPRDDKIKPPPAQHTALGDSTYARGGHGIFGQPKVTTGVLVYQVCLVSCSVP